MTARRHLYVHLPFCAHRCGYCDFVTVVGRGGQHAAYVDALLRELELERELLAESSRRSSSAAARRRSPRCRSSCALLDALPAAEELTVEANPETVTAELAAALRSRRREARLARRADVPAGTPPRARARCRS